MPFHLEGVGEVVLKRSLSVDIPKFFQVPEHTLFFLKPLATFKYRAIFKYGPIFKYDATFEHDATFKQRIPNMTPRFVFMKSSLVA